jgi:hypothetical protein
MLKPAARWQFWTQQKTAMERGSFGHNRRRMQWKGAVLDSTEDYNGASSVIFTFIFCT